MSMVRLQGLSWPRLLLSTGWACFPAFLFYLLVLQEGAPSLPRLAVSTLLVPMLAYLAYRTYPRLRWLSRGDWAGLLAGSAIFSGAAVLALSHYPQKMYLLEPQHRLEVRAEQLAEGRMLQLHWFQTSLGDVSFDSFQSGSGWRRVGDSLSLISNSNAPLVWTGWTGSFAKLSFSASHGVKITVSWDGEAKVLDFGQKRRQALEQTAFETPWWSILALDLLLWVATVGVVAITLVNSPIRRRLARVPSWAGWTLMVGSFLLLMVGVWHGPLADVELLLLLALALVLVAPMHLITDSLAGHAIPQKLKDLSNSMLQKHSLLLILMFSLVLALGIFGRSIWTNWSVFDDHQIMEYVGPGRGLSFGQMLADLPKTEIGQFGQYPRFRPTYWFLRLLECVVWGARPYYWHAFRVLILVVALSMLWHLASRKLGWVGAGLLCAYTLTFSYWGQIIGTLGPGETYAVVGLPIYAWGLLKLLEPGTLSKTTRLLGGAALIIGTAVCAGSKENFVLLGLPSIYLAYRGLRARDLISVLSAGASILFVGYVVAAILLAVSRGGIDIYGGSTAFPDRISQTLGSLQSSEHLAPFLLLAGLTVAPTVVLLFRGWSREMSRTVLRAQLWLAILCGFYLTQLYFYNGLWPDGTRYDFPGLLYLPAALMILALFWIELLPEASRAAATRAARSALATVLLAAIVAKGYGAPIRYLEDNLKQTRRFVAGVEAMVSTLRENPDYALVVESGSVNDYETVFSYLEFLRAYGAQNRIFLRIHGYSPEADTAAQEDSLAAGLVQTSVVGKRGFAPLSELRGFGAKCFSLDLSAQISTECRPIN